MIGEDLDKVLRDHEKRIGDLERRPIGCVAFHASFYAVCPTVADLPPPELYGYPGVGYLVEETGFVWAWTGDPPTWNDGPGRTLDDWLPAPATD